MELRGDECGDYVGQNVWYKINWLTPLLGQTGS